MNNKPIVSVIVPCYNLGKFLPEALNSLIEQTFSDWECVIVDDGSTDNTKSIALEYVRKDSRFIYYYKENEGVCIAKNFAISKSKGKYILPLDSDDLIEPEYIEEAVSILDNNSDIRLVYCDGIFFGEKSGLIDNADYSFELLLYSNLIHNSALFYKKDFDDTGGYSLEMKDGLEDWEFWINLLKGEKKTFKIPKPYLRYRIRSVSRSKGLSKDLKMRVYFRHLDLYERYWGTPFELYEYKRRYIALTNLKSFKLWRKIYDAIFLRKNHCSRERKIK